MSQLNDEYQKVMDEAPEGARIYIEEVRSKLQWALFSQVLTLPEATKDALTDIVCLFCLSAYQQGQRDILTHLQQKLVEQLGSIKESKSPDEREKS